MKVGDKPDLLATSGECLKIWKIKDNQEVSLELNLKNVPIHTLRTTTSQPLSLLLIGTLSFRISSALLPLIPPAPFGTSKNQLYLLSSSLTTKKFMTFTFLERGIFSLLLGLMEVSGSSIFVIYSIPLYNTKLKEGDQY